MMIRAETYHAQIMRIFALALLFLTIVQSASARDCGKVLLWDTRSTLATKPPSPEFYKCILAEIRDLKEKQAELDKIIPEYNRLIAEVPTPYTNDNGEITYETGRAIGSASFLLDSRQLGGPSSLELDQDVLFSLCATPRGCSIALTFRRHSFRGDEVLESVKVGPCDFEINPETRRWVRGPGCDTDTTISGTDGDGSLRSPGSGVGVIVEAGPGCVLADADVQRSVQVTDLIFATDHAAGVYLIADPSRRTEGSARFECDLELN